MKKKKKEPYVSPQIEIVQLDLSRYMVATSNGDGSDQNNDDLNNWA